MGTWTAQARPGLAEGALDDLGPLLRRRHAARDSAVVTVAGLVGIDERLTALQTAVTACGADEAFLRRMLGEGDPEAALAVAAVAPALADGTRAWQEAVAAIPPPWWPAVLGHALRWRSSGLEAVCAASCATLPRTSPVHALAECLLAAYQRPAPQAGGPLLACLRTGLGDPSPHRRALCWQVIARRGEGVDGRQAALGLGDEDAGVRRACAETLVWTRHPDFAQEANAALTRRGPGDEQMILQWARLASPEAAAPLSRLALRARPAPLCVELLRDIALPLVVPALITVMDPAHPAQAIAAGQAFRQLTGVTVDSDRRVTLPTEPGRALEEVDQELRETGWLPDPDLAQRTWAQRGAAFDPRRRMSLGRMVGDGTVMDDQAISTSAWRSACMRAVYVHGEPRTGRM